MKFKRVLALLLATVMLLGVATSCGKGKDDGKIAITDHMTRNRLRSMLTPSAISISSIKKLKQRRTFLKDLH